MKQTCIPRRSAGILLPVSSLPSPYGIGTFGASAYEWVDFLETAGQRYWQVLPLSVTGYGDSPYQSFSAFAGNPYFIDFDLLSEAGLLDPADYQDMNWGEGRYIDYGLLYRKRESILRLAARAFTDQAALTDFRAGQAHWLDDYALFMAIKRRQGGIAWTGWPDELRNRDPEALRVISDKLVEDIRYEIFVQYAFSLQWQNLHSYAKEKGIEIIGDIPIYVALDSADVWVNRSLFKLGGDGLPVEVAGCPPDAFAANGQVWGNPLYDWTTMADNDYAFWIRRVRYELNRYDVLRIDHFRGLESYYAIPAGDTTARNGRWYEGPGHSFIETLHDQLPNARIIAEDLGYQTDEVQQLVLDSGFPGMKVLQFAFDSREPADFNPYNYPNNSVIYTGTHDNNTLVGWINEHQAVPDGDLKLATDYLNVTNVEKLPEAMLRCTLANQAVLAVIPVQDWLGLDEQARLNTPSTTGGINWRWRLHQGEADPGLAARIKRMCTIYGRA